MSNANFLALIASRDQHEPRTDDRSAPPFAMNKLKRYFNKDRLPPPRLKTLIRLQNDLVVVHPRTAPLSTDVAPDESAVVGLGVPDDTLLFGHAEIDAEPYITIHSVHVGLVVVYRYQPSPEDKPRETIIFEQYKAFTPDEILIEVKDSSRLIHRRVNFDILVPASLPTYDHSAHGILLPQVRVKVEFGYGSLSRDAVDSILATSPGVAGEEKEDPTVILGRRMVTDRWQGGTVYVPPRSYAMSTHSSSSDSSLDTVLERRVQTWVKNMAVIANPNPTTGTHALRVHKTGIAPGIGEWHVYLLSDSFSVGGYVIPRLELTTLAPTCTIYAIQMHLHQIIHITRPEEYRFNPNGQETFNPAETTCPSEKILIHADGVIPGDRRPRRGTQALWDGRGTDGKTFVWQQDKVRLADESKARPSTVVGTSTIMRFQHEIGFRIFFSIEGETIGGDPIPNNRGKDQTGEMRMLVLTVPCFLASCCCIAERVKLPEYSEKKTKGSEQNIPMCACCQKTSDFATPPFPPEFLSNARRGSEPTPLGETQRRKSGAVTTRRDLSVGSGKNA